MPEFKCYLIIKNIHIRYYLDTVNHISCWSERLEIPNSGCRDDSNKEDTTPAERVRRLEDEDVLEKERVQLCQLWR